MGEVICAVLARVGRWGLGVAVRTRLASSPHRSHIPPPAQSTPRTRLNLNDNYLKTPLMPSCTRVPVTPTLAPIDETLGGGRALQSVEGGVKLLGPQHSDPSHSSRSHPLELDKSEASPKRDQTLPDEGGAETGARQSMPSWSSSRFKWDAWMRPYSCLAEPVRRGVMLRRGAASASPLPARTSRPSYFSTLRLACLCAGKQCIQRQKCG
jgi:hypothetical protein